jgi:putative ABC transport system ATP-binding protein
MSDRPIIETQSVTKNYELESAQIVVLRGVSLSVNAGETVSIMGASGSGKSTLLHLLGGLDRPTAGDVFFEGVNLRSVSNARRTELRATAIGFVFQSYHLLHELDIVENIMLPAMSRPKALIRREQIQKRALSLLDSVGLSPRAKHRPLELSGGEQQRAALARALMNEPRLLLADEPTGNLDSKTGDQVLDYLFALTRERGHTLVLVTHNQAVAERCQRRLVLRDGVLQS